MSLTSFMKPAIVGIALAGGVLTATAGLQGLHLVHAAPSYNTAPAPLYARNSHGQTYGSDAHATSLASEPDLILAQGTNGRVGYLRKSEIFGKMPKTPQQAVAMNAQAQISRKVPLYASNGTTIIGTFIVGPAKVQLTHTRSTLPSHP